MVKKLAQFIKDKTPTILATFFIFSIILLPRLTFAVPPCDPNSGVICNPIQGIDTIDGFIKKLLEGIIKIGFPIVAVSIIYSGFLFVFARGNSEKLDTAKRALLYSVIGAAILLGSWAIAILISDTVLAL